MTSMQRPDRSTMKRDLDNFVHYWSGQLETWKSTGATGIEKSFANSFWSDLLSCFGINAQRKDLFERQARRSKTGGRGYIDLFWPRVVIGEAKSPGIDLENAYQQVLDYLNGGDVSDREQPRHIICTNFEQFRLIRLGEPEVRFDITFPLSEVTNHLDELKFFAGYEAITAYEEKKASLAAAKLMADLFVAIAGDEVDEETGDEAPTNPEDEDAIVQESSMFLTRLLFLLFGDDTGLWEHDLFYRFILDDTTPENLGSQLNTLFQVLDTPVEKRHRVPESMKEFPYVNGAIFGDRMPVQFFNPDMRDALINACRFHWADISPAIFGSLFQLVKSKEARRSDGEHYTSEKNILKTIEPLFLDELRAQVHTVLTKYYPSRKKKLEALRDFQNYLASLVFCDPACGSGNFLIIAYRELRKIETDIIVARREILGTSTDMALDVTLEQKVTIDQFHGIELNWWPAKIAETAMFLVDHHANQELAARVGEAPERLPIKITAHIHHGNALKLDWAELLPKTTSMTYVFGNPPFIGARIMNKEQKEELGEAWGKSKRVNQLDYVTGWHAKAMKLFHDRRGEFAFVTTNSITQGQPVPLLFDPLEREGWRIKFAHRTFKWDSEAPGKAAVHCVIVGFSKNREVKQQLWDYPDVQGEPTALQVNDRITPYLIDGSYVLVETRSDTLSPVLPVVDYGSMPNDGGNLLLNKAEYEDLKSDPIAMKYVRPFKGARELLHNEDRWCLWMADGNYEAADLKKSAQLKSRVEAVEAHRRSSKREATKKLAETPYLFGEIRQPKTDYVCIPAHVSENRKYFVVSHFSSDVISGNANFVAIDPDGFLFGLISSSMFITWQRTVGGRIKSDLRFSAKLSWNTFPLPKIDEQTRQRIINAGQKVLAARSIHPERSLADQYNPLAMDPKLLKAHDALDKEVDKAMGAPRKLTTMRQRQELLFKNYVQLTSPADSA